MNYVSTRDKSLRMTAAQAIVRGLAPDGGLMTPEAFLHLPHGALEQLKDMSYQQRAVYVMQSFLQDFSSAELSAFAQRPMGMESSPTQTWPRCARWMEIPGAWSCGTGLPAPSRIWRFRCCPICSPPP